MIVTFSEPFLPPLQKNAHGRLSERLSNTDIRPPAEMDRIRDRDRAIGIAYGRARSLSGENISLPQGFNFTPDEVKLASWIAEYAKQQEIPFKKAMDHIFEFLRRDPKNLALYAKEGINFAEDSSQSVSFCIPAGWSCSPEALNQLQKLRIYQAGTGCSFTEAIASVGYVT